MPLRRVDEASDLSRKRGVNQSYNVICKNSVS